MADVRPQDVLFRAGGATLKRLQTLVSGGASRVEVAHTFSRGSAKRSFRDRDGNTKVAASTSLAIDWPSGLVDASGATIGGPLIEGIRPQLITSPENFGAWTVNGTPVLTSGQGDPFGTTNAYLVNDDNAADDEGVYWDIPFTGDGIKAFRYYIKANTATISDQRLRDNTAAATRLQLRATWTAGVPSVAIVAGSGTVTVSPAIGVWYPVTCTVNSIIAANQNRLLMFGATTGFTPVGATYYFGVNAWDLPFATGYQGPAFGTAAADSLTAPYNLGPQSDITILVRLARPGYADLSGALGMSPGIFSFGAGTAPRIGAYFDPAARNIIGVIDTATTDATVSAAIPAGNPTVLFQFKNLTTGGQVAIDTGSGLSAFSSAATAFSAFSSQTVRLGRYDDELYGVLGDIVVMRGLFSRTEALAVA